MGFQYNDNDYSYGSKFDNQRSVNDTETFLERFTKKFTKKESVLDLLPYKRMNSKDQLISLDGNVEEYYLIRGKALKNTSNAQGWALIDAFNLFTKTYVDDIKIFVSMFPTETDKQQRYFTFKLNECNKEISEQQKNLNKYIKENNKLAIEKTNRKIYQLRKHIEYIKNIFLKNELSASKNLKNQEYLMVIYGTNSVDIRNKVQDIKRWGGEALELEKITPDKKIQKIASFLNPTELLTKE